MQKNRRKLIAALILGLSAATIAGCSDNRNIIYETEVLGSNDNEIELSVFGFKYEPLNVLAMEDVMSGFMEKYPDVTISYEGIKSPEYFEVLEKRIESGSLDDIFMVDHASWLELEEQGKLADLSGLSTINNYNSLVKSQMRTGELIDYVPTSISAFGFYCNMDLLQAHNQKVPENLAQLEEVCDYFVAQGITPIVANNDISLKTVAIGAGMYPVYQKADPAAEVARFNSETEELVETLRPGFELVEQMIANRYIDAAETLETAKTKDDLEIFAKGEQPFMLTGAWAVPRLRELEPDFTFEIHPYPILEDGGVLVINVDTRFCISADSPDLEVAMQFLEYLTQQDNMWEFVNSQGSFSPLEENRLADDAAVQPIGSYMTNGRTVIGSDDYLQFPIWNITRECVTEMLDGGSAADALALLHKRLQE